MSAQALAQFLRLRMRERGLSNSQIAAQAGISRQTWYNLLNAQIKEAKFSTLVQVCRVLDVHPMELLGIYFADHEYYKSLSEV
ncbi:MAG: helix-turn-helix domain-containing protein [Thiolinea sp.]